MLGQNAGRIKGVVRNASGAAAAGVIVVATNQVSSAAKRVRSEADGTYSIRLSPGAYRISLELPYTAKFDKDAAYGDFAIPRGDTLENVIVEPGRETIVDIVLAEGQRPNQR